jgi:hypothetical protein
MVFVRKLHGLHNVLALSGNVTGTVPEKRCSRRNAGKQQKGHNGRLDLVIRIFMVDLRQGYSPAPSGIIFEINRVYKRGQRAEASKSLRKFSQSSAFANPIFNFVQRNSQRADNSLKIQLNARDKESVCPTAQQKSAFWARNIFFTPYSLFNRDTANTLAPSGK